MIEPLKGSYPPLVLSDKINALIEASNSQALKQEKMERAIKKITKLTMTSSESFEIELILK